jgi:beta-glucosidase-like glycosyl hydrolase
MHCTTAVQQIAKSIGSIGARDSRAAALPWLYSPIIGVAHSQLWPRVYETFGEDPLLSSIMGTAMITGIQVTVYMMLIDSIILIRCMAVAVILCVGACPSCP